VSILDNPADRHIARCASKVELSGLIHALIPCHCLPELRHTSRLTAGETRTTITAETINLNRRHLAIRVGLMALSAATALPGAGANSPAVPSLCTRLATQMRQLPERVTQDATSPSPNWQPWVVSADLDQPLPYDVYSHIAAAWQARMGSMTMQGIETVPKTDLFMAFAYAGAFHCLAPMFFTGKTGDTLKTVGSPADASSPCEMSDQTDGGLATVLGEPAYIESGPLDQSGTDSSLLVVPWLGTVWAQSCTVSVRVALRYPVTQRYCGSDQAVCNAARQIAPRVERQYEAYSADWLEAFNQGVPLPKFRFNGELSARDQTLIARAKHIARSTAESRGAPARLLDAILTDFDFFPLRLDHKLYLGAVTGGANPADIARWFVPGERYLGETAGKPESGTLLVVYQAPGAHSDHLQPLAVFGMRQQTSGIESIQASDDNP
jgi:hypothetical protein